jgi:hypothetical protein
MTRSETFLGNKNAKALPSVPLGFRLREQVRPGLCEHHVAAGRMQREPAMCDCGFHGQAIFLIAATGISKLRVDHGDRQATGVIGLDRVRQL